ncbi:hypothetical protein BH23CHL7_BH23CHL7_07250 [soil metagenome]
MFTRSRWIFPVVGLAVAIVAALAIYAFVLAGGQRQVTGTVTLVAGPNGQSCGFDGYVLELEGSAALAHLGNTTVIASNCSRGSLDTGPAVMFEGSATYTASDGSSVTVAYDGSQMKPVAQVGPFRVLQTVTGGTGRFANATGEWTITGEANITNGETHGDVTGWISY